jgi:hypothetical protein
MILNVGTVYPSLQRKHHTVLESAVRNVYHDMVQRAFSTDNIGVGEPLTVQT